MRIELNEHLKSPPRGSDFQPRIKLFEDAAAAARRLYAKAQVEGIAQPYVRFEYNAHTDTMSVTVLGEVG